MRVPLSLADAWLLGLSEMFPYPTILLTIDSDFRVYR